jgi:hypothetical protein
MAMGSRGQGRSSLKYTNIRLCISLERKVCLLEESLGFHKYCRQVLSTGKNLAPKLLKSVAM